MIKLPHERKSDHFVHGTGVYVFRDGNWHKSVITNFRFSKKGHPLMTVVTADNEYDDIHIDDNTVINDGEYNYFMDNAPEFAEWLILSTNNSLRRMYEALIDN